MTTIQASVPVLCWAAERAGLSEEFLCTRFPKWPHWIRGEAQPTLRQLESFAKLTHTAFGYFFLPEPPKLVLPVPDFRTIGNETPVEISSELLDTIYLCQQRQAWYRDHARLHGLPERQFVGSVSIHEAPEAVARDIRETLGTSSEDRRQAATWTDALRQLITKADETGVLVMVSSIVGSNSHRKLDLEEFRGFALADGLAPLIFVNGADSKSAQMFTLAHELAHIWLGESGLSDTQAGRIPEQRVERWCNQVAAELLVPINAIQADYEPEAPLEVETRRLARVFKVSTLVILRRIHDAGFLSREALWSCYREEEERLRLLKDRTTPGGEFYRTLSARSSKRFASAVVSSTLEGLTSFPEAFRMLGLRKTATFYNTARELGVAP